MQFQLLTKDDCEDLLPLFLEMERFYFKDKAAGESEVRKYLHDGVFSQHSGVRLAGMFLDSVLVAFASYSILYPAPGLSGQMYMKDLFVSESVRGRRVGVQLMKHMAKLALDHGCQRLDWTAESTNPKAGQFYQSIGASLIREKEYYRFAGEDLRKFAEME